MSDSGEQTAGTKQMQNTYSQKHFLLKHPNKITPISYCNSQNLPLKKASFTIKQRIRHKEYEPLLRKQLRKARFLVDRAQVLDSGSGHTWGKSAPSGITTEVAGNDEWMSEVPRGYKCPSTTTLVAIFSGCIAYLACHHCTWSRGFEYVSFKINTSQKAPQPLLICKIPVRFYKWR